MFLLLEIVQYCPGDPLVVEHAVLRNSEVEIRHIIGSTVGLKCIIGYGEDITEGEFYSECVYSEQGEGIWIANKACIRMIALMRSSKFLITFLEVI